MNLVSPEWLIHHTGKKKIFPTSENFKKKKILTSGKKKEVMEEGGGTGRKREERAYFQCV